MAKSLISPISDSSVYPVQAMELALPISIVDKDMISIANPEYMRDYGPQADTSGLAASSKGEKVALILLAPLMAPLLILDRIACVFWEEECGC